MSIRISQLQSHLAVILLVSLEPNIKIYGSELAVID